MPGESRELVDVIVPIAFTLSSAGKLLSLAFILFAGWMSGFPLAPTQIPQFLVSGVFSFFASTAMAIPFLLDLFRIPADAFQLFLVADNVVGNRFGSLLASVHILSLTLLGTCGAAGLLAVRRVRLVRWGIIAVVLVLGGFGGLRLAFESIDRPYQGYQAFIERSLLLPGGAARSSGRGPSRADRVPALERIRASGVVRVAWARDRLPLVFRNQASELVGFDVEMAHALARGPGRPAGVRPDRSGRGAELLDCGRGRHRHERLRHHPGADSSEWPSRSRTSRRRCASSSATTAARTSAAARPCRLTLPSGSRSRAPLLRGEDSKLPAAGGAGGGGLASRLLQQPRPGARRADLHRGERLGVDADLSAVRRGGAPPGPPQGAAGLCGASRRSRPGGVPRIAGSS